MRASVPEQAGEIREDQMASWFLERILVLRPLFTEASESLPTEDQSAYWFLSALVGLHVRAPLDEKSGMALAEAGDALEELASRGDAEVRNAVRLLVEEDLADLAHLFWRYLGPTVRENYFSA